jgi:HK97 family phage major capsid protein
MEIENHDPTAAVTGALDAFTKSATSAIDSVRADLAAQARRFDEIEAKANRLALTGGGSGGYRLTEQKAALVEFLKSGAIPAEAKAHSGTVGQDGGFAVNQTLDSAIQDQLVTISPIRSIARVVSLGAGVGDFSIPIGRRGASSVWVSELTPRPATDTPNLGLIRPPGGEIMALAKVSNWLLNDAAFNLDAWLSSNLLDEFALRENAAFVSGSGVTQPQGFLSGPTPVTTTDATRAFGTLMYVPSGGASGLAASNPLDAIITLVYSLTSGYRANATFVMNSNTAAAIAKIKTTTGEYIWQPAVAEGQPARILGYPVVIAEEMPDLGSNTFPIAFGDFSRGYVVVDKTGTTFLRDPYTEPGQVRIYAARRTHGAIADSNAIRLFKCATS